jgi:UDP-N-acetylmuramoyl-tripeptide--D-alanyl-D-alanine ligase
MKTEQLYSIYKSSNGISTDTRTLQKGEMFFALWGGNFNGNQYAAEALEKGASVAVIDDPQYETDKTILVDDCLFELQALAAHYRKELKVPVLGITGTNGKTTTKELIAAILSVKKKVHFTRGNLNNHIGVPLTILSAPPDTEMMIIEMGANHIGEIRTLCLIAKPDYGIITNIGTAHIEGFGSFDGVVKAKSELYEYLKKINGVAIYNDKNNLLAEKIFRLVIRAVPYSDPTGTDLIIEPVPSDLNLKVTAEYEHKTYTINTNLFGKYNLENIRAAVATGLFLGIDMPEIVKAIENYVPGNNRSQIKVTKSNTIICDSYNANPKSMISAIESFSEIESKEKMLILGDMLELGEKGPGEHINVLNLIKEKGFKNVLLVGPIFSSVSQGSGFKSFKDIASIKDYIAANPVKGKYLLVKGSRGIGLERIYDLL